MHTSFSYGSFRIGISFQAGLNGFKSFIRAWLVVVHTLACGSIYSDIPTHSCFGSDICWRALGQIFCWGMCEQGIGANVDARMCRVDEFIDMIEGNRKYIKCLYCYNKIDAITMEEVQVLAQQPNRYAFLS